jgi:hypothetical protein
LSAVLPTIWALVPGFTPLRTIQAVLGPRRQLTATSFGNATGTVGVEVVVGGAVVAGSAVCVSVGVASDWVADGVINPGVGVSVGRLDGRLQADRAKTRATINKLRNFITLLLNSWTVILYKNLADGNSSLKWRNPRCGHIRDFDKRALILFCNWIRR